MDGYGRLDTTAQAATRGEKAKDQEQPTQVALPKRRKIDESAIRRATQLLEKYKAGKRSVEWRIIDAQQWWKLRNWEQIRREYGIKGAASDKSSTAWLWNCIVGKHADAMDSFPEPVILPRAEDDKEEAARLTEIVPVVLKNNDFEQTYSDCAWQKMLEGTGAYGVFWDKDKLGGMGDVTIRKINVLNLFWEPGVQNIQDSANVFHVSLESNEAIEAVYPQARGQLKGGLLTVSEYQYDDHLDVEDKSLVVDWYYHVYESGRKVLHYVKFVSDVVLYATEDDPMLAERGLYDDGQYPFVLDVLFPVEGSPCGYGYVYVGKDTQKDIDTISQAVVKNAVVCATPRFFARQDGNINEQEFADWSKPIVHVTGSLGTESIMPIQTAGIPGNAISLMQQKIEEIRTVTGNTDVSNGAAPSGVTAASAIAALQESAGKTSKDSSKAAYRAYALIVNLVIERIRQFYDLPRQFRITGKRGEERYITYVNAGIVPQAQGADFGVQMGYRLPVFDIDVRAQRETGYTKAAQNELAIQLYQLGVFNPQMTDQSLMLLDMMDFRGREEIVQKVTQLGTMQQMLVQYQQIALALAQKYEPGTAEQLAAQIMQTSGQPVGQTAKASAEKITGGTEGREAAHVEKARQHAQSTTAVD